MSLIFQTEPNIILIMKSWCNSRGFKMILKNLHLIVRSTNNLKRNDQKRYDNKLHTFFTFPERKDNWLILTKLYAHDILFLDICNLLVTARLICKIFCQVKNALICASPLLSNKYSYLCNGFFLWNSQEDYANSCINWWKLLLLTGQLLSWKMF